MTTEFQDNSRLHDTSGLDDEVLDEIVSGYIDRLNDGEMLDRGKILSENSQFGPAIWTRLELFHELADQEERSEPLTNGGLGSKRLWTV